MLWRRRRRRGWVVEVHVEDQRVFLAGVSFLEFAGNGAVGRADVAVHYLADDTLHVCHLSELPCRPVVKESSASKEDRTCGSELAWVVRVVEGARVEPYAVNGSSDPVPFLMGQKAAALVVVLPFLERVYVAPFLSHAA